jgi:hypothetical protein
MNLKMKAKLMTSYEQEEFKKQNLVNLHKID